METKNIANESSEKLQVMSSCLLANGDIEDAELIDKAAGLIEKQQAEISRLFEALCHVRDYGGTEILKWGKDVDEYLLETIESHLQAMKGATNEPGTAL